MRLNTAQRLALNLDAHIVIDAGAGTGKTLTITERIIEPHCLIYGGSLLGG